MKKTRMTQSYSSQSFHSTKYYFDNGVYVSVAYGMNAYAEVEPLSKWEKTEKGRYADEFAIWERIEEEKQLKIHKVEIAIFHNEESIIQEMADGLGIDAYCGGGSFESGDWEPLGYVDINDLIDVLFWSKNYKAKGERK